MKCRNTLTHCPLLGQCVLKIASLGSYCCSVGGRGRCVDSDKKKKESNPCCIKIYILILFCY